MLPPAVATGIGSMPGTASHEWSRVIAGEIPELVHVPELPARGPGSDMVGRTMALLADVAPDLAVDTTPTGWRFADAPGRVMQRARSWLSEDLDGLQEALGGKPTAVKEQLVGPWTLAAAVEMRNGERAVRDHGAVRDLAEALAEAAVTHVADLSRRFPACDLLLQWDEPSLPSVLAGGITTASGLATYRAVDEQRAQTLLSVTMDGAKSAGARTGVHCCHPRPPVDLLRRSGAEFVSVDLTRLEESQEEALGHAVDAGLLVMLGVVPSLPVEVRGPAVLGERAAHRVLGQFSRWGFSVEQGAAATAVTPTCGLAGSTPAWVRSVYSALREAGRLVRDDEAVSEDET